MSSPTAPRGSESLDGVPGALDALQDRLGHRFACPEILEEALTHPGADASANYERLEFLGDRVLGLLVADELLRRHPDEDAGRLALRFNAVVRKEACARAAAEAGLGAFVRLARAERAAGGATRAATLADVGEAVLAALYLDGGIVPARRFVHRYWIVAEGAAAEKDPKTRLQEWAHRMALPAPAYRLVGADGPAHAPRFRIEVGVGAHAVGQGSGASKRAAEQAAAAALLRTVDAA